MKKKEHFLKKVCTLTAPCQSEILLSGQRRNGLVCFPLGSNVVNDPSCGPSTSIMGEPIPWHPHLLDVYTRPGERKRVLKLFKVQATGANEHNSSRRQSNIHDDDPSKGPGEGVSCRRPLGTSRRFFLELGQANLFWMLTHIGDNQNILLPTVNRYIFIFI